MLLKYHFLYIKHYLHALNINIIVVIRTHKWNMLTLIHEMQKNIAQEYIDI